ncbi:hypothetical protein D3C74_361460 [compost metagenome]
MRDSRTGAPDLVHRDAPEPTTAGGRTSGGLDGRTLPSSSCVQAVWRGPPSPELSTGPGGMSTSDSSLSPEVDHCVPNPLCTSHSVLCTARPAEPSTHKLVHLPVDNCGRRGTSCGQRRPDRWTANCGQPVVNSASDLPTGPSPVRPHGKRASDLGRERFSTLCTAPMTTTNDL